MRPRNENAPASAEAQGADTTGDYRTDSTASRPPDQGARYVVLTTKASFAEIVFGVYKRQAEAAAVAARLREVGGNAHVVEVRQ